MEAGQQRLGPESLAAFGENNPGLGGHKRTLNSILQALSQPQDPLALWIVCENEGTDDFSTTFGSTPAYLF